MHQGRALRNLLEEYNIKVGDFAEKVGVSRQTISNNFKRDRIDRKLIEKVTEITGLEESVFEKDKAEDYKNKYHDVKEKYLKVMEDLLDAQKKILVLEEKIISIYENSKE